MTYMIAETGINHGGSFSRLMSICHLASEAGFDAVKFQLWKASTINRPKETREALKPLQLDYEDIALAAKWCRHMSMETIVSVFTTDDLEQAEWRSELWDAYKVSHIESQDADFVARVRSTGKRMILSAKAGECPEHEKAHSLWCCPEYPTSPFDVDWYAIKDYAGFSDHTGDLMAGASAAAFGAKIIEVHITDKKDGLDAAVSIDDPKAYVEHVRQMEGAPA